MFKVERTAGAESAAKAVSMKKRLAQVAHEKAKKKASAKATKSRPLRPGQPSPYSSLDDVVEKRLCEYLQAGVPIALACDAIGLARRTFYDWEKTGIESDDPKNRYKLFMTRVRQAQALGFVRLHLEVRKLDPKWLLGRCAREHYPPEPLKAELSGPAGLVTTPFVVEITCSESLENISWGPIIDRSNSSSLN
jgi:hypothetical protein